MLGAGNRNGMLCNEVLLMFMRQTCCVRKIHDNGSYLCCRKTFCEIILYVCFWETFPLLCFAQKLTRITFFFFFFDGYWRTGTTQFGDYFPRELCCSSYFLFCLIGNESSVFASFRTVWNLVYRSCLSSSCQPPCLRLVEAALRRVGMMCYCCSVVKVCFVLSAIS